MTNYYFAYGSNMNPERMLARGLISTDSQAGQMPGYELLFNKRAADAPHRSYANIGYNSSKTVEGVLYRLQSPAEIQKMDVYEGTPRLYSREIYEIETERGPIAAWVYIANAAMLSNDLAPERWYLAHLLAGKPFLSTAYFNCIAAVACVDDP